MPLGRLSLAALRWLVAGFLAALAALLGTLGALTQTGPGRAVLARVFTDQSDRLVRGRIVIGAVGGNFARGLTLDSVSVRDTLGFPLLTVARLEVRYRLAALVARRVVLDEVRAVRPRIHLLQRRDGRLNFEEVLRLGEGPPGGDGGGGPLIEFRNVTVEDGIVTIRTPWNPPGEARTAAARDSMLRVQRQVPGRRIEDGGPEGLQQIRTLEGVHARLARLRVATPDRQPLLVEVDSLAARLNDPLVEIAAMRGTVTQARDTLWFDLPVAALPGTRGSADGLVAWPQDTVLFNFSFDAERLALADLRFVSPDFPDWTGRGQLEAYSYNGTETQYLLRGLELGGRTGAVAGALTALTHRRRGLGFRGLDLTLTDVDLEVVRPYLDTVPFRGRLSGSLRADGYVGGMAVALDWTFYDERVAGQPPNHLVLAGEVALGGGREGGAAGGAGLVFREVRVVAADLDLATVRLAAPAVRLGGRLSGEGVLDGPWRQVTFTGALRHQDGDRPASAATGWFRLDTRAAGVRVDAELDFAPLSFEGMRGAFPDLTVAGDAAGPVRIGGTTERLWIETNLRGDLGHVVADGAVGFAPAGWRADSVRVWFSGLDLSTVRGGREPRTALAGRTMLQWTADRGHVPTGIVELVLGPSWIRELRLDTAVVRLHVADSVVQVDTAYLAWAGGAARAQGGLGWSRPRDGRLDLSVVAPRLAAFDSMLAGWARVADLPEAPHRRLDGALDALVTVRGALDSFDVSGEGELGAGRFATIDVPRARARFFWQGKGQGPTPAFDAIVEVDSLRAGRLHFGGLRAHASGVRDSLVWRGYARTGTSGDLYLAGTAAPGPVARVHADTVELRVLDHRWQLQERFTAVLGDSVLALTPVRFRTDDGAASITLEGSIPNAGAGEADLRVAGLDLRDIAAVLQRDTAAMRGLVSLDLRLLGTATRPELRGTAALTGPVFGDFRAPLGRVAMRYTQRRLNANVTLWRTGRPLMEVNVMLPLDLGWRGTRPERQLPGQVAIRAVADSMDLAVVEAFTRNLRRVRGTLSADVTVQGTWDRPQLGGTVTLRGGRAAVPNLGVVYGPIGGRLVLTGDSIVVDSLRIHSRRGTLDGAGAVRLERLTQPVLDLRFRADNFLALDVPDYLTLEADGDVRLRGPVFGATLTGSGTARNSVLYFSDLVSKTIVNLEDPLFADLVDTATIRRRGLGAAFQSRFLDSLTIRDFRFTAAEGVWLRSSEANVQLEGAVVVQKTRRVYRLDGSFSAPRGTYTFKLGPVTRAFDVTRGVVRYFNTPDLNADLDIEARHLLQSGGGEAAARDVEVIAQIRGTLRAPRLTLESTFRPPLSQSDIVSLLVLGQTLNSQVANAGVTTLNQRAMTLLFGALSSELERAFVGESGLVDLIEIRPGLPYGTVGQGASLTRLAAGWQLGTRWWVSLNAGFCPNFQQFDHRNFGVSLDYRLNREWSVQTSAEPMQACLAGATTEKRYQLGGDLRWNREF